MAGDNSVDILSDKDIELLFASFPDLKEQLPDNAGREEVVSYMNNVADECGLKQGASQVLEYAAVAAAMKLRAKIALGELKSKDLKGISPELKESIMQKAEIFKNSFQKSTPAVNRDLSRDIRDMDFETAVSILPLQDKLNKLFYEKLVSDEADKVLMREDAYKFMSLTMISGNETGSGRTLEPDEFTETMGRRLINGPVEQGDDNDIFKTFAALSLTANALQCHAAIQLGKTFPEYAGEIEKNSGFFRKHAAETLAVCQTCGEHGIKFENAERMKQIVGSSLAKNFAYDAYAPIFDFYADVVDVVKGRCPISSAENAENSVAQLPQRLSENQATKDFVNAVRFAAMTGSSRGGRYNTLIRERA